MNVKRAFDISRISFVFTRRSLPDFIFEGALRIEEAAPISTMCFFKNMPKKPETLIDLL
jgi:hypothetical protein